MLSNPQYRSRFYNYQIMKDYLDGKITPWEFREKYIDQRHKDLDDWEKDGHTDEDFKKEVESLSENEKKFRDEYAGALWGNIEGISGGQALKIYEEGIEKYDIKGGGILYDIYNFMEWHINDYYPSDREGFDKYNTNEKELYERVKLAYDALKRHKKRWEIGCEDLRTNFIQKPVSLQSKPQEKYEIVGNFVTFRNYDKQNIQLFKQKILDHINDPNTIAIAGKYRACTVVHFYNPNTQLNVIKGTDGGFKSGWKLEREQHDFLKSTGKIGGN